MIVNKKQRFEKKDTSKDRFYISKDEFSKLLVEYRKTKVITNELGEMLLLLSKKIASSNNFRGYTFIDDCIQEGLLTCLKYIHNYDPEKSSNPFGYFSQIIIRTFLVKIKAEQSYYALKKKLFKYDEQGYLVEENDIFSSQPTTVYEGDY